jgi:hypothetical protein
MESSFWSGTSPLMPMVDALYNHINDLLAKNGGRMPTGKAYKALDRYRRMAIAYQRRYNDGDHHPFWNRLNDLEVEQKFSQAVQDAWREQFVPTTEIVS